MHITWWLAVLRATWLVDGILVTCDDEAQHSLMGRYASVSSQQPFLAIAP